MVPMNEIVNSIILATFGIIFGIFYMIIETYWRLYDKKLKKLDKRSKKPFILGIIVLVFILIIELSFSSVHMDWLIFICFTLLTVVIYKLISHLAEVGKIKVVGESFLDIPLPRIDKDEKRDIKNENVFLESPLRPSLIAWE